MSLRTFAAIMLILGVILLAGVSVLAAEGGWDWWFTPVLIAGIVLTVGGITEGTS